MKFLLTLTLLSIISINNAISQEKKNIHMLIINSTFSKTKFDRTLPENYTFKPKLAISGEVGYHFIRKVSSSFSIESGIRFGAYPHVLYLYISDIPDFIDIELNVYDYNMFLKIPLYFSYWFPLSNNVLLKGSIGPHILGYWWWTTENEVWYQYNNVQTDLIRFDIDMNSNLKTGYHIQLELLKRLNGNKFLSYGLNFGDGLGEKTQIRVTYPYEGNTMTVSTASKNWYLGFNLGYMF